MTVQSTLATLLIEVLRREGRLVHASVLTLVEDLTDAQVNERIGPFAPPIAFHLWHLARWADWDVHQFDGVDQIWHARGLAQAWGFPAGLGENDTGTELDDEAAEGLVFPPKAALYEYARVAFQAVDEMLDRRAEEALQGVETRTMSDDQLVSLLNTYVVHENRHLGMIEALRGRYGSAGHGDTLDER